MTHNGQVRVMRENGGIIDFFSEKVARHPAAQLVVIHGDTAVVGRFSIKQYDRIRQPAMLQVVHIFIGSVGDDNTVKKFILQGFHLLL